MCGIMGYAQATEITRCMSVPLALYMETRGHDSWGVTDGDTVYKRALTISEDFMEFEFQGPVIYHTRAASCGAVSDRNAHPFDYTHEGKRVVGIHNGHLRNWMSLKSAHNRADLEVDSEHIFRHLAEGKDVGELDGWGAVAWFEMDADAPQERRLYLSKFGNMDNLHIARLTDSGSSIVFASTKTSIEKSAKMCGVGIECWWPTVNNMKYEFLPCPNEGGKLGLYTVEEMPWGKTVPTVITPTTFIGASSHGHHRGRTTSSTLCNHNGCNKRLVESYDVICQDCIDKLLFEHYGILGELVGGMVN